MAKLPDTGGPKIPATPRKIQRRPKALVSCLRPSRSTMMMEVRAMNGAGGVSQTQRSDEGYKGSCCGQKNYSWRIATSKNSATGFRPSQNIVGHLNTRLLPLVNTPRNQFSDKSIDIVCM